MKKTMILYFLCLLTACNSKIKKEKLNDDISFKTRADTEIFFKNVRLIYYDLEAQDNTKLNLYRFKARKVNPKEPIINLTIVHNWRFNEAYILVELNEFLDKTKDLTIEWINSKGKTENIVFPKKPNKAQHYDFAKKIYEGILQKQKMKFKKDNQSFDLFPTEQHSEIFRKIMVDYLRLVGKL